jgi:hypothetical protein
MHCTLIDHVVTAIRVLLCAIIAFLNSNSGAPLFLTGGGSSSSAAAASVGAGRRGSLTQFTHGRLQEHL